MSNLAAKTVVCSLLATFLSLGLTPSLAADERAMGGSKPNVLLIVADDLGYGELGCYGQRQIKTPNVDRLAASGIRFTQFYAGASLCASSRNVLLTGEHTGHCRIRDNGPPRIQTLRPQDVTITEVLKKVGYSTAIVGKWAIGGDLPETGGRPEDQGFDYFFGYLNSVAAHNYWPRYLWRNREKVHLGNVVRDVPPGYAGFVGGMATKKVKYSHDLFVDEAKSWIRAHKDDPFFLFFSPTIPHANPEARKLTGNGTEVPDLGIYAEKPWSPQNKGHAAMISRLDRGVGELIALLGELDIERRTLVVFTSDNGPHNEAGHDPEFFDANGPLRGRKFELYEGGIRVPAIISWPGAIKQGVISDQVAYFGDFMATLCDLADVDPPMPQYGLDSINILPTLMSQAKEQEQHKFLYWELPGGNGRQAVRFGPWKAIRRPLGSGETSLFHLGRDVGETRNVAEENPEIVRRAERYMSEAHVESPHWPTRKRRAKGS